MGVVAFGLVFYLLPVSHMLADGFSMAAWHKEFGDGHVGALIRFTLWQASLSTLAALLLAIGPVWALRRLRFRGRSLVMTVMLLPFVVPTVVAVSATLALFGADGWLMGLVRTVSLGRITDIDPRGHTWSIVLVHAWFNFGMIARLVVAYEGEAGARQDEAAQLLGASPWRRLLRITGPRLAPAWRAGAALTFLLSLAAFATVLLLGGTKHATIETEIFRETTQFLALDRAAVLALIQFGLVTTALLLIRGKGSPSESRPRAVGGRSAGLGGPQNGLRNLLAAIVLATTVTFALAPLASLVIDVLRPAGSWGLDAFRYLGTARANTTAAYAPGEAIANSLTNAAVAMTIAIVIGGAVTALATRRGTGAKLIGAMSIAPLVTSPVTLGFGMMLAFSAPPLDFRSRWWLLPVAHSLVAVPLVVRTLIPAVAGRRTELSDAARTLGAGPLRRWFRIDLPILAPAIAVSLGLAFVVSLGEFGASSFLARPQRLTVPIAIGRALGRPGARSVLDAHVLSLTLVGVALGVLLLAEMAAGLIRRVSRGS